MYDFVVVSSLERLATKTHLLQYCCGWKHLSFTVTSKYCKYYIRLVVKYECVIVNMWGLVKKNKNTVG